MENSLIEYRNFVFNVENEQLPELLEELVKKIIPTSTHDLSYFFQKGLKTLGVEEKEFNYETFNKAYYRMVHKVVTLHHRFAREGLLTSPESTDNYVLKFNKLFEILYYWEQTIRSSWRVKQASDPLYDSTMNTDVGLFRFKMINPDDNTPYQNLLLYLLSVLAERGYRRQADQCMDRIYTSDGYDTHAWKPAMSIKDFVNKVTNKDDNYQQWHNSTINPTYGKKAVEYLESVCDLHFIDVIKDRHMISFNNGIYETAVWVDDHWEDRWYPHDRASEWSSQDIEYNRSACNYFDYPFDNYNELEDWYSIPTPHFQSILDSQEFSEEVCRWMYILVCGRILYEVGELDDWQIMAFLKGRAGTGKSTIITKVCKNFFHPLDVGVLSNNTEQKFGLSALHGKFLFIAPEVKGNFGLEQCDFQTMISGEDTSVAKKFETAKSVKWIVPGVMAGNEPPDYKDNQGSIARRIVVFEFLKTVKQQDPSLGRKLMEEIPILIKKGNRAYLDTVNKHGKKDIWNSVLPSYFKETRKEMSEQTNSLAHFLGSNGTILGEHQYILQTNFVKAFNDYCKENNLTRSRWNKDYFTGPFEANGVEIIKNMERFDPFTGTNRSGTWLKGIDVPRETSSVANDDGI